MRIHLSNLVGVKKFGGSKAGMWGSTIGLLIGPFVIPVAGILLGPFLGAVIAELVVSRSGVKQAVKNRYWFAHWIFHFSCHKRICHGRDDC